MEAQRAFPQSIIGRILRVEFEPRDHQPHHRNAEFLLGQVDHADMLGADRLHPLQQEGGIGVEIAARQVRDFVEAARRNAVLPQLVGELHDALLRRFVVVVALEVVARAGNVGQSRLHRLGHRAGERDARARWQPAPQNEPSGIRVLPGPSRRRTKKAGTPTSLVMSQTDSIIFASVSRSIRVRQ